METAIIVALPGILKGIVDMIGVINAGGKVATVDVNLMITKLDELIALVDANDAEWRKNNPGK